jgi:glycosyltransferase involved in cell wall biosynthesis
VATGGEGTRERRAARGGCRIGIDARKLEDGGIGRYVVELLRRLPAIDSGAHFVVLATAEGCARIARELAAPNLETVVVSASGYGLREHVELGRAARAARLDLLHVPHYVVPATVRCPVVVTVHDLIHWRLPRSAVHAAYVRLLLALVRARARLVLTPSSAVARDLEQLARIPADRLRVVPNGVDAAFWGADLPEDAPGGFAARHGLAPRYVLNVTNGLPHKGLDLLLAAWREVTDLQLVLVGQGSDGPAVHAEIARAALDSGRVAVLGALTDAELRLAYRGAAAVVVASRLEGFGLPALEAMAAGVPVLVAEAGALPEVVGDAGLVFPVDSVACLLSALYRSVPGSDLVARQERIRRGLARARELSWDRTAQETHAAYGVALHWRT